MLGLECRLSILRSTLSVLCPVSQRITVLSSSSTEIWLFSRDPYFTSVLSTDGHLLFLFLKIEIFTCLWRWQLFLPFHSLVRPSFTFYSSRILYKLYYTIVVLIKSPFFLFLFFILFSLPSFKMVLYTYSKTLFLHFWMEVTYLRVDILFVRFHNLSKLKHDIVLISIVQ